VKLLFDENVSRSLVKLLATSYVEGFPPKIIWLDVGNTGTLGITALLRRERRRIEPFDNNSEASLLILSTAASPSI